MFGLPALCIALVAEFALIAQLVANTGIDLSTDVWMLAHLAASALAGIATTLILGKQIPGRRWPLMLFFAAISFFMPFIGTAGAWLSVHFGAILANGRHKENVFWQYTSNADLPFAAPIDRPAAKLDSRGFMEQLLFDGQTEQLYNKVAATRHIRDSQSAPLLKTAIGHENERIRLVAYQMLDKKVTRLNREIQRLEADSKLATGTGKSNIHLQIANNYWELLTIEEDEPVAREELLMKAEEHAAKALGIEPGNVNAQFVLGQVYLKQQENEKANRAFTRAVELGMSSDKVLPYIAESAFKNRDFKLLRSTLNAINPAFRSYPPFSQVIEFWA
jgi:tetratricopeptide (TPR) repeat protein